MEEKCQLNNQKIKQIESKFNKLLADRFKNQPNKTQTEQTFTLVTQEEEDDTNLNSGNLLFTKRSRSQFNIDDKNNLKSINEE